MNTNSNSFILSNKLMIVLILAEETVDSGAAKASTADSEDFLRKYGFDFPARESPAEGNNGSHVLVRSVPSVKEEQPNESVKSSDILDKPNEIINDSAKSMLDQ